MYFVYILKCFDGSLYTGITTDLERRIKEHNSSNNLGAKYTRSKRPVILVYFKSFANRSLALKQEFKIKSLSRIEKMKIINSEMSVKRRNKNNFKENLYRIVKKIPKGSVMTYKQVAEKIGNPRAYRAVGNILSRNHDSKIPCHRVIRSDGKIGGYNKGEKRKRTILRMEGYLK